MDISWTLADVIWTLLRRYLDYLDVIWTLAGPLAGRYLDVTWTSLGRHLDVTSENYFIPNLCVWRMAFEDGFWGMDLGMDGGGRRT